MRSTAAHVDEYLASLPDDRRTALESVREVVLANLPDGYEEGIEFGMISYHIPLARYPDTYIGEAIARASVDDYLAAYERTRTSRPRHEP